VYCFIFHHFGPWERAPQSEWSTGYRDDGKLDGETFEKVWTRYLAPVRTRTCQCGKKTEHEVEWWHQMPGWYSYD
jgi:hypothetical protein